MITKLNFNKYIILNKEQIEKDGLLLGSGAEGRVYKYNDDLVIKIFYTNETINYKNKYKKISYYSKFNDISFTFPKGLILDRGHKIGYYMNYIAKNSHFASFANLNLVSSRELLFSLGIKASEALKKIHELGFRVGDLRGDNILIDENDNPIYIDTDNFAYHKGLKKYEYDLISLISNELNHVYHKKFSYQDKDIYLLSKLIMKYVLKSSGLSIYDDKEFLEKLISLIDCPKNIKDGLEAIFSDSENKPYIGDILKEMDYNRNIISEDNCLKLERRR